VFLAVQPTAGTPRFFWTPPAEFLPSDGDEAMMPDPPFDPSKTVTFDLSLGLVHRDGAQSASLLVPADALLALIRAAGADAAHTFARALGAAMGRRVLERLGSSDAAIGSRESLRDCSVESVVDHLAGELAVGGLGALSLERWGNAAVLVLDGTPLDADGRSSLVEAIFEGVAPAAFGGAATVVLLHHERSRTRLFLGGRAGTDKVGGWVASGVPWGEALVRLHAPAESHAASPNGRGEA
jgi:hypothetical protein